MNEHRQLYKDFYEHVKVFNETHAEAIAKDETWEEFIFNIQKRAFYKQIGSYEKNIKGKARLELKPGVVQTLEIVCVLDGP